MALWAVIASVTAAAFVGIVTLLLGEFGEIHGRILGTTFFVLVVSLIAMGTAPAVARRWLMPLPLGGIGLAVAGFSLLSVLIWTDEPSDGLLKLSGILIIWSVAIAHASLLSAARLPSKHLWALVIAYGSAVGLATLLSISIANEFDGGDGMARAIGVVAIAAAASAIAVPVLHRMSGLDEVERRSVGTQATGVELRFCPACAADVGVTRPGATMDCPNCRTQAVVNWAKEGPA